MKNFTKIALSGIIGIALTACGSSSSSGGTTPTPVPNDVNYTALTNTGTSGYKINVDINGSIGGIVDLYPTDFYFCTESIDGYDYFAIDPSTTPDWNGTAEPEDYGWLNINASSHLVFTSDSGNLQSDSYTITQDDNNETLTEGQTYSLQIEGETGTVTINTISDFNCSTLIQPI